jgi:hypothetical protein
VPAPFCPEGGSALGCVVVSGRLPASFKPSVAPLLVIIAGGSVPAFLLSFRTFATAFSASASDAMVKVRGNRGKVYRVGSVGTATYEYAV